MEALATGLNWSSERYLLRELVGSGGMSQVYRAWDKQLDREVAVKVLHPHLAASADSRKRFSREARAVAKLHHPHILEIFDFSGDGEGAYIVTEFIEGTTLRRFSEDTGFGLPQIGALAAHSLCLALEHAHAAGIVHRDLKPENVMVSRQGVLKLMDFGIARFLDQGEKMTMTGAMVGSPAYMAPEVIEGKEADARSDLFSLGTLLYWLLTGTLPFDAPNTSALLKRVLDADFQDPRLVAPTVPDSMAAILFSLLKRDPLLRPESAFAVRVSLTAALAEDGITGPEAELKAFLADPAPYRARFRGELLTRLKGKAQTALSEGRSTAALKLADRVLALEPEDVETRRILDRISAQKRRAKRVQTAATLLGSGLAIVAMIWGGHELWFRPPIPEPVSRVVEAPPTPAVTVPAPDPRTPPAPIDTSSAVSTAAETSPGPPKPLSRSVQTPAVRPSLHSGPRPSRPPPSSAADDTRYDQRIVVAPWADVAIDGKPSLRGVTRETLHLPLGHHVLTFSATGRRSETRDVDINALNNPDVRLPLYPLPAHLRVIASPPDASVMVDNQSYGTAQQSPFTIDLKNDATPTVDVDVFKTGYREVHQRVQLRADTEQNINVTLQPLAGTP